MDDIRFVRVCSVKDIREGHAKCFVVGKLEIAIYRSDGKVYATGALCSHEDEHLCEGWLEGHTIECPRHGAQFDLKTGEALSLPATDPISVYETVLEGDDVKVGIPAASIE